MLTKKEYSDLWDFIYSTLEDTEEKSLILMELNKYVE